MNQLIESLILVDGENVDVEKLRSRTGSLPNAKVLEIGSVPGPGNRMILHGASNSTEDLRNAFLMISQVPGVKEVLPLTISNRG